MADQAQGPTPLQQFIAQHMEVQQFLEQQRAQGVQEALATRQLETQELGAFMELAGRARNPQQLTGVIDFMGTRSPNMLEAFQNLGEQYLPDLQQQEAAAAAGPGGMTQSDFLQDIGLRSGRFTSPAQVRQLDQGAAELDLRRRSTDAQIRQGDRGLDLDEQRIGLADARERDRIRLEGERVDQEQQRITLAGEGMLLEDLSRQRAAMFGAGLGPFSMWSEQTRMMQEKERELAGATTEEEHNRLTRELAEIDRSSKLLEEMFRSNFGGKGPEELTMAQAHAELAKAQDDISQATTSGNAAALQAAYERYNRLAQILGLGQFQMQEVPWWRGRDRMQFQPSTGGPPVPDTTRNRPQGK